MSTFSNWLQRMGNALGMAWRRSWAAFANARRRAGRKLLPDYIVFTLSQHLVELAPDQPWWMRFVPGMLPPLSLRSLHAALRRVADDPDVRGVLFLVKGATFERTHAQNLAALLARFRAWDRAAYPAAPPKTIHFFLEEISASTYLAACAADRIYVTPLTTWEVVGMRIEAQFYRDALAQLGVHAEVVKVAPWKTAADNLAEAHMTQAARDQYEWLLESLYSDMVDAISTGRGLDAAQVRSLLDSAPYAAADALAAGLIDAILYEDELPAHLGAPSTADDAPPKPARLRRYGSARGLLYRRVRPHSRKTVGLLELTGSIVSGSSRSFPVPLPLLGSDMLGSSSVQQAVRAARRDDSLAAIVAYIDSPGGSALASDIMWRELTLLAQEKPLVVYMGPVAASGGYYIAAPARWIVAQAATLTGSIGVITAKVVTAGAYDKLHVGIDTVQRGANADLYADTQFWRSEQRAQVEAGVEMVYTTFKQRVAEGRKLSLEAVDNVAGGRVWTGAQAIGHGLVDALGDLDTALEKAAALADIPADEIAGELRVAYVDTGRGNLLAQPLQQAAVRWARQLLHAGGIWMLADELPRVE